VELADQVLTGDPWAIARAISIVESESTESAGLVGQLFGHAGRARVVGVTGAPGVGKSTLVDRLTSEWRRGGTSVGILAIDPTSPFTGGAILGDRIRMQAHADDEGVYVRSMATRGHLGGLARATNDAVVVLDAAGKEIVLIETVGVGQGEVDVARTVDVAIVVTVPGTGDDVQALKAGIMEIADIFVVNKTDRDGADRTMTEIESMLALRDTSAMEWRPPVLKTRATTGEGVPAVLEAIGSLDSVRVAGDARRRERALVQLREILTRRFLKVVEGGTSEARSWNEMLDRIACGTIDPYRAADEILRLVLKER